MAKSELPKGSKLSQWIDRTPRPIGWLLGQIAAHYVGIGLAGLSALSIVISTVRDAIWNALSDILHTPPLQWPPISIAIVLAVALLVLALTILEIRFLTRRKLRTGTTQIQFAYHEHKRLNWRYRTSDGYTEKVPYCIKHGTQYVEKFDPSRTVMYASYFFYCTVCGVKESHVTDTFIEETHSEAVTIIQALVRGELQV